MSTVLLLRLYEPAGVAPVDETRNLKDLWIRAFDDDDNAIDAVEPAAANAWAGGGRTFDGATMALAALDAEDGNTLLQRDVTIVALLSVDIAGMTDPMCVVARGCSTDPDLEPAISWGLELQASPAFAGYVEARLYWSDYAGARKTAPPGVFRAPGAGKEFMLTVTRRWETTSRVVVRYYVNDEPIAEVVSLDGAIGGDTTFYTSVGAELDQGAAAFVNFFKGTIDQLQVLDLELSAEEVRQIWRRLTEHQPGGVETMVGLMPPGLDALARQTSTNEGRRIKVAGEALGFAVAQTDDLRELWLPDHAPLEIAPRWEKLKGITAKPRDHLDRRRARLLALFAREAGYSPPAIQTALAELFDQLPEDVELIEFTNEFVDNFTGNALNDARWLTGSVGEWSVASDHLELHVDSGEDLSWLLPMGYEGILRMSLDRGDDNVFMQGVVLDWGTLPANTGVGVYMHDRRVHDLMWFGVWNNGSSYKIAHRTVDHRTIGAVVELAAAPGSGPLYLRMETDNFPGGPKITVSYSTDGVSWVHVDVFNGMGERMLDWGGFAAIGNGTIGADIDATFDNFLAWCPGSVLPFCWYAYRDPALAGAPDMIGSHLVVQKVKPAHTHGAAIQVKALLADDPLNGLCDHHPVGGFDSIDIPATAPAGSSLIIVGSIPSGEVVPAPVVVGGAIAPSSLASAGAVGTPSLELVIAPSALPSAGAIGSATLPGLSQSTTWAPSTVTAGSGSTGAVSVTASGDNNSVQMYVTIAPTGGGSGLVSSPVTTFTSGCTQVLAWTKVGEVWQAVFSANSDPLTSGSSILAQFTIVTNPGFDMTLTNNYSSSQVPSPTPGTAILTVNPA